MTEYVNGIDVDTDYECLYWYDGPMMIKFKSKNIFAMCMQDPDDDLEKWLMTSVEFTDQQWEDYINKKVDLRTFILAASNPCIIDLNVEPIVFQPTILDNEKLPYADVWHWR